MCSSNIILQLGGEEKHSDWLVSRALSWAKENGHGTGTDLGLFEVLLMRELWNRGGTLDAVLCGVYGCSRAVYVTRPTASLLPLSLSCPWTQ